jgi:hypothetical protein
MAVGRRARTALAGAAAIGLLGLAGCGGSGYEYVSNADEGLHFRVPDGWTVVEVEEADTGVPEAAGQSDGWTRLLDRSPTPGVANYNAVLPLYPVGVATVESVGTLDDRDTLDYATLRAMATNDVDDPLALASTEDGGVEVISLEDVTEGDMRGERIVFNVEQPDGSLLTVDQTALVDPLTTQIYRLLLKCEAHCYESNRDEIDEIVDSWTVEED